jgi:DNA polymerase-3 subunit gamma/tau
MARSLNCEKGPAAIPCGVCSNCQEISRGSSLDVIEIDGASNTSVNDVRQIKDEVLFPPNSSRYKIYIIDEVHMLSNSAFNALLKTIEEPPPYIVFIFATTELHKVPATIKSRCQQFAFRLIPIERIAKMLSETCNEMNIQAEDEALFWIAKESTGSLRDAYTLFDQVASFSDGNIRSELIREKLGLVGLDKLNSLADACAENNTKEAFAIVDDLLSSGIAIEQFVVDLSGYYRSLLLLKNGVTRDSLLGYSPDRFSSLVLEKTDSVQIERGLSLLLDLYRDIRYSVSPRFELETAVSKLAWINKWISSNELKTALDDVRQFVPQGLNVNPQKKNETGQNGEIKRPLAEAGEKQSRPIQINIETDEHSADSFLSDDDSDKSDALTEGFKRLMSAKDVSVPDINHSEKSETNTLQTESSIQSEEEKLVPLPEPVWDNYRNEGTAVYKNPPIVETENDPTEDKILQAEDTFNYDKNSQNFSISDIKIKIIDALRKNQTLIASGLEKSLDWEWDETKLIIPVRDFLVAELLQKEINLIKEQFVSISQKSAIIEIIVRNDGNNNSDTTDEKFVSPQVEMVRQFFRGTVIKAN